MVDLFRAEWKKVGRHFLLTAFTVWIIPVGIAAFIGTAIILAFLVDGGTLMIQSFSAGDWTKDTLGVWGFFSTFPANVLGRLLPMGFMATMFAGEFQWKTWKNIVPRSSRPKLVITKFAVLILFVMLSLFISSGVTGGMAAVAHKVSGLPYGPAVTVEIIAEFLPVYINNVLLTAMALLVLAGFATLASMMTRSILGGLLAGFGLSVVDPVSILVLGLAGSIFNRPELVNLYCFTSSYQLDNIRAWLFQNQAFIGPAPTFTAEFTLAQSLISIVLWIVGLVTASVLVFNKIDIAS